MEDQGNRRARSATPIWWLRACLLLAALGVGYCAARPGAALLPLGSPGVAHPLTSVLEALICVFLVWPFLFTVILVRKRLRYAGSPTTVYWLAFTAIVRAAWRGVSPEELGGVSYLDGGDSPVPWMSAVAGGVLAATSALASPLFCHRPQLLSWSVLIGICVGASVLSFQKARALLKPSWISRDRSQLLPRWLSWSRKDYEPRGLPWAVSHHVSSILVVALWLWGGANLICR